MKTRTLEEIEEEVYGEPNFHPFTSQAFREAAREIAKRYARECVLASLERAARNATHDDAYMIETGMMLIDKKSITDEKNIVL